MPDALNLETNLSPGSLIEPLGPDSWRFSLPPGPAGRYRLAQLDNCGAHRRNQLPHQPPFHLSLEARTSSAEIPGTWGFGVWNDPFGMGLLTGKGLRLPTLPNTAWFFHASPENYLSVRDDLPGYGWLAATFQSKQSALAWSILALPALPLLFSPAVARWLRRAARRFVRQEAVALALNVVSWHTYAIEWRPTEVVFTVDGTAILRTQMAPCGPLGLVLWIDNQYAAFDPQGNLRYGMLANPEPAWLEVRRLKVTV